MTAPVKFNWARAQSCAVAGLCLLILSGLLAILSVSSAAAHEGHDHGPIPTIPRALPRAETQTDLVEMVAVYDDGRLFIYLDHFSGNAPITGADLQLKLNDVDVPVREVARGIYTSEFRAPGGEIALMMTVTTSDLADVLIATIALDNASGQSGTSWLALLKSAPWLLLLGAFLIAPFVPAVRNRFRRPAAILP